jgi:O-antigen chain-terminating methyltransferase
MSCEQTDSTAPELELAKIKARADLLLALYTHVAHDLEQAQSERERLRDERDQARGELVHARSELRRFNDDLHLARVELGQGTLRAAEMQQRYEALLSSTSWRLTAPVRALVRLVKR